MEKRYCYDYPMPAVTADVIVIQHNCVLLIKRGNEPFKDKWAIPGGFVNLNEDVLSAARRELFEETCLNIPNGYFQVVDVYSKPGRDPRGWTISVAYLVCVDDEILIPKASDDAAEAKWFPLNKLPIEDLAFDHFEILRDAGLMLYKTKGFFSNK